MVDQYRTIEAYKNHVENFISKLSRKVKDKIFWTFRVIEEMPRVLKIYLKSIEDSDGLLEIGAQHGGEISEFSVYLTKAG